jgi:zinc/manganese transport system ATP-binding protein
LDARRSRLAIARSVVVGCLVGELGGRTNMSIELHNLTVSYRQHPALHHLSGTFAAGSLTAVVGPNGAGKSTLLKSIAGLIPVKQSDHGASATDAAAITLHGASQRFAYLPQHSELDRSFPISVRDCVLLGLWQVSGAWGTTSQAMLTRVDEAIHTVGLQGFEKRPVGTLSSGQLQRALYARLLVQDAPLILLDEPFAAVDSKTIATLMALTLQWHREGRTVIVVLHDDAQVHQFFPQTLLLARECIAWGPTHTVLTAVNWKRARAMSEAWDETAAICDIDGSFNGQSFESLLAARRAQVAQG